MTATPNRPANVYWRKKEMPMDVIRGIRRGEARSGR